MKIEELDIKVLKAPTLFAVRSNNTFRKLTVDAHVATYKVNDERCLGVTFEDSHDGNIKSLGEFCKRASLESAIVEIPWRRGRTIVFIRQTDRWSPARLRDVSQGASGTSTDEIENIEF